MAFEEVGGIFIVPHLLWHEKGTPMSRRVQRAPETEELLERDFY